MKNYPAIAALLCWVIVLICNLSLYSAGKRPTALTVILMNVSLIILELVEVLKS